MNLCRASLDLFGQPIRAHLLIPSPFQPIYKICLFFVAVVGCDQCLKR